jgi:pilus assembly protein CpaE
MGSFRDLALVEYVLSGMRVDLIAVDSGLQGKGESLDAWMARCKTAFPGVSLVLLDSVGPLGQAGARDAPSGDMGSGNLLVSQTVVVWSPKGGVGKTFLATNLACAGAVATQGRAGLVDMDLYSGDASVHLDLMDRPTITELLPVLQDMRPEGLDRFTQRHAPSGLSVICSPRRPELSELVTTEHVKAVLALACKRWALLYVDTPPDITSDVVGECIDAATKIVLVVTQDVATLKQSKLAVDIFTKLGIPRDSLAVVLNRSSKDSLMPSGKVQEFLGVEILGSVPDDRRTAERSVFEGKPAVLYGKTEVSEAIWQIAERISPGLRYPRSRKPVRPRKESFW